MINKYVKDANFSIYIPAYKLGRKIVIKEIPTDITLEEVKAAVEDENQRIIVKKIFRLKRKDRVTREWLESESICLHIVGEELPNEIVIFKTINPVYPYIEAVRMCYKCGFFGKYTF